MKITVTTTVPASPDGVTTELYRAGQTYDLPEALAALFLREKWGKAAKQAAGPAENK
jgi:hypothetical protein